MSSRITHLDAVRGVAVLAILIMNGISFGLGNVAYFDLSAPGTDSTLDWLLGIAGEVFADQKFMGLFSLLFGASILLFLERVSTRTARPVGLSLWRNTILLLIGLAHAVAWEGDILVVYALCAPVLLLFRGVSSRVLVGLGVLTFSAAPTLAWFVGQGISASVIRDVWRGVVLTPETELMFLALAMDAFARALGMMLIGMGLYRSGAILDPAPSPRLLRWSVVGVGFGAVMAGVGLWWAHTADFDAAALVTSNIFNSVGTLPMTLGYLGLLIAWDGRLGQRWAGKIRAVGRMALTNYLLQTVLGLTVAGLASGTVISRTHVWGVMLFVWALQLWGSERWLRAYRYGPVEWLWRSATYRRLEPLKRRMDR